MTSLPSNPTPVLPSSDEHKEEMTIATTEGHIKLRQNRALFPHYCDFDARTRKNWLYAQFKAAYLLQHQVFNPDLATADVVEADRLLLAGQFKDLTLPEIEEAIRNGCAGLYGEYFGMTTRSLLFFLEGYVADHRQVYLEAQGKPKENKELTKRILEFYKASRERSAVIRATLPEKGFEKGTEDAEEHRRRVREQARQILGK